MAVSSIPAGGQMPMGRAVAVGHGALAPLLPMVILFYATLIPLEVRFKITDLTIYPYRAAVIALLPWLLYRLASERYPLRIADSLFIAGSLWMWLSFAVFYGPAEGLVRGGGIVLDILPAFVIARLCIREPDDLRRMLILIAPGLFLAGFTVVLEAVTHVQLVRPFFTAIFGRLPYYTGGFEFAAADWAREVRIGLLRASGPFSHPILAGLFLASLLPLYLSAGLRGWPGKWGVAAGLSAFFSVSSAAVMAIAMGGGLVLFDRFHRYVSFASWRLLLLGSAVALTVLQFVTQNGVLGVLIRFTFNPATGHFRMMIWEYGSRSVMKHPWFGIGYSEYERLSWMTPSVDNQWLLLAIRHGIFPAACFLIASLAVVWRLSLVGPQLGESDRRLAVGVAIALSTVVLLGFTVSFFGGMLPWFCMLLGLATSVSFPAVFPPMPEEVQLREGTGLPPG